MSDKKLDDLEKNIDELISLSQKLKDSTEVRLKNLIEENK